jgi:nucleoside-diphosphate-sugar epimerase
MKVLVTGATGYIGNRLVSVLQQWGHDVKILVRRTSDSFSDIEQVIGNLANPESLTNATLDVEVVFHLGGGMRPSDGDLTVVNIDGTVSLMQDAIRNRVRRFIFLSAAVVYGDVLEPPVSEVAVCNPLSDHMYASTKLVAEQKLISLEHNGTDLVIVRIPQVYNMGSPSINRFPQLASMVEGNNLTHFVHREDVVQALLMLADVKCAPGIYNIADDHPLTVREAASIIKNSMDSCKELPLPGGTIPPMLRRVMEATMVLNNRKITGLGFSLKYPSLDLGILHET